MVQNGDLGEIRQVHLEYIQGYLAEQHTYTGWRLDPQIAGPSLVLGDIATHAFHLGSYVTGLEVNELMANIGTTVPGRTVDDYVSCLFHF